MNFYSIPFYSILAISAFLIALLGTRLTILALRKRTVLIDRPNARSNHRNPTPKGGGIAVMFAMIICLAIADINYAIILSILLLAAISLLDDIIGVPMIIRLLVQIISVGVALSVMPITFFGDIAPPWFDKFVIGFVWVWFINLFNFMDGIDGISATEMISIGGGLALLTAFLGTFPSTLSTYSLIVAAAAAGFLWWNWHPAKIFLGDVGSVPIGFVLGYLLLLAIAEGHVFAAIILPAYYLADGTITILRRLYKGKKIWIAHSEHYYQKAVRNGRRHSTVVRYIFGINILLVFLGIRSSIEPEIAIFHVAMAYLAVFMLLGYFAHTGPNPHHDPS